MLNEQIKNYIEQSLSIGKTEQETTKNLLGAGWKEDQINELVSKINNQVAIET